MRPDLEALKDFYVSVDRSLDAANTNVAKYKPEMDRIRRNMASIEYGNEWRLANDK